MKEMMDELKDMKHTAVGASGMPSVAWQACGENEDLRIAMLKVLKGCCIFFDCVKAFDEISRECAWQSMEVMGVDTKTKRAVQATLKETTCKMNIGGVAKVW